MGDNRKELIPVIPLTAGIVASRVSGYERNEIPDAEGVRISMGVVMGDYYGHWVKVAWLGNANGIVIDYGAIGTSNAMGSPKRDAAYSALAEFCRGALKGSNPPDFCLINTDESDIAAEFGNKFAVSKGRGDFESPDGSEDIKPFTECYAQRIGSGDAWLYKVNTEYWMHNMQTLFSEGALLLHEPNHNRYHTAFAQHVVAEKRVRRFVGGSLQEKWVAIRRGSRYLEALALAGAASACLGVN